MTVEAYSSLSLQAGGAVAAAAGRTALWVISAYMRQPLRNTALAALIGLSTMAGSNALYKQSHHHPAPLFGSFGAKNSGKAESAAKVGPIMPATRPLKLLQPTGAETTGNIGPLARPAQTIDSAQVMAMQQKLAALKLLDGGVDGLFGPRTARAIKAFEQSIGRQPRGLLSQQIVDLVATAQLPTIVAPAAEPVVVPPQNSASGPALQDAPTATPVAQLTLAAPKPLAAPATLQPQTVQTTTRLASVAPAPLLETSDETNDNTGSTAGGVETVAMTKSGTATARSVPTIAVHATIAPPEQAMPSALDSPPEADASTDPQIVASVQRALNSLGFLHGNIDGVAGETTAKAIRNFEVYYNYNVTGRITADLVKLLVQNGGVI